MKLRVESIDVAYGKNIVLRGINVEFEEGTLTGIVGPNGSGKSTFLKTIAALLRPVKGTVYIDFKDIFKMSKKELAKKLSIVLTERPEAELMTVRELVALGRHPYTGILGRLSRRDEEIVEECLKLVNALHLRDKYFTELSDGERQKVLIARALAQEPEILILDEPTTFLDIRHRMEIMTILRDIARKKHMIIIASLHELDIAARFCDQIIVMRDGRIVARGLPEEVLNESNLRQVYSLDTVGIWGKGPLLEIKVTPDPTIFILAGSGTGVPIYRLLARAGIGFYTGILYSFDIDHIIASTMNAGIITLNDENPNESIENALRIVDKSELIIDSGFPRTRAYEHNLRVVEYCKESGKKIIHVKSIGLQELSRTLKDKLLNRPS